MKTLLIGMGMVAPTHLAALRDNQSGIRLAGVVSRSATRAEGHARQATEALGYPVPGYATLAEGLSSKPDFALLITPPDTRSSYVGALAAARIPILMEKPIERTFAAAQEIVATCDATDTPLGLCFQHRTRAASSKLKALLDGGALGQIVDVDIRVPWWRDQHYYDAPGRGTYARDGGGVMINQAIHTLDLALWLCGPVANVQARMRTSPLHRMEAEDIAAALLEFRNGASGVLSASTIAYPGSAESVTLIATQARAHLEGGCLTLDWLDGRTERFGETATTGGGADPMAFTHAWHQTILEDFADALRAGRPPLAPGLETLHVHAVIDAMTRSAASGHIEEIAE
ncbi:Gfo/Idh/MocA family protein [Thalassococcus sp. S3]|uniref:Gfo/Idh/MocA family protein n=1 Tax=Thalassococcus sp. S3 TaxID=2017482 RepID=UPI0010243380|nr:Gfo/Idh/MocA family oxidoreductase [Thalassococcus sp. S3]QBF34320.1 oxidoreductase [Thalassococcus sp. S3]